MPFKINMAPQVGHMNQKCRDLVGYIYEQVTADTGSGASLGAFHGQTIALGPCLTFSGQIVGHAIGLNARYYNEVKVKNRLDGLTCPPKTDPHVKLEYWIKGRQGDEQEAVYSGADH
jgi:hypothetical protein